MPSNPPIKTIALMNKIYALLLLFFAGTASAQTVFTYGSNAVDKEEFLKAYNKNRSAVKDKQQSLREYLDLYINFKLKVKSAEDEHLDTSHSMLEDTKNFRDQIEASYLNNDSIVNVMTDEALQRQQKDIHLLHFYVPMTVGVPAKDTLVAYNAIQQAYTSLATTKRKKESAADIIKDISEKYIPVRGGDFGFVTAFTLPYQYENTVYALKPGQVSEPYRSKNGWHFFLNLEERKAIGKWKIAQIFFAIPPNSSAKDILSIEHKVDSVYKLLMNGADFAVLAKQYSQDRSTYMNGGKMPEFGTGKYDTAFEAQAFALKTDSAVSEPFHIGDGFHILKRLGHTAIPENPDVDYRATLKQQVLRDPRNDIAKEIFMQDLLLKTKYKRNTLIADSDLIHYANNSLVNNNTAAVIISFEKENNTIADWLKYVADKSAAVHGKSLPIDGVFIDQYINAATLQYYKDHLEDFNTDFKYQMQEFTEGNLLFEVMQKEVWNKAANDSAGLLNYYNQHKEKYTWVNSADLILFNCTDSFAATEIKNGLINGRSWRAVAQESQGRIQADSNRYELSQIQAPNGSVITAGTLTAPLFNMDNTASLVQVVKIYPANQQRSFAEAKGLVINDYQTLLEADWLAKLKKKYPVTIDEKGFKSLLK
jgi:peptidyl-prolyl cis-trans isomerase SurA